MTKQEWVADSPNLHLNYATQTYSVESSEYSVTHPSTFIYLIVSHVSNQRILGKGTHLAKPMTGDRTTQTNSGNRSTLWSFRHMRQRKAFSSEGSQQR